MGFGEWLDTTSNEDPTKAFTRTRKRAGDACCYVLRGEHMRAYLCVVLIFFISGCTSTLKYIDQYPQSGTVPPIWCDLNNYDVFVVNAEQYPKEYKILLTSGKFRTVDNPNAPNVTLNPLGGPYPCGTPLLLSIFTLGLLPSSTQGPYSYSFTINDSGVITECNYRLITEIRYSIWEWFRKPFVDEASVLGECLKHSMQQACEKKT